MERHILREETSSSPKSSSCSQGVPTFAPPWKSYRQRRPNASDRLHISGSTPESDWSDCLILTAWFSYHVVSLRLQTCSTGLPRGTAHFLFTNHNVTACQSTQGHQERIQNPYQQSLYNKNSKRFLNWELAPVKFVSDTHTHTRARAHTHIYIYIFPMSHMMVSVFLYAYYVYIIFSSGLWQFQTRHWHNG